MRTRQRQPAWGGHVTLTCSLHAAGLLLHATSCLHHKLLEDKHVLQVVDVSHERMTFSVSVAASMDKLMKI